MPAAHLSLQTDNFATALISFVYWIEKAIKAVTAKRYKQDAF